MLLYHEEIYIDQSICSCIVHLLHNILIFRTCLQVAAAITGRVLFNTTVAFSNVLGPVEEIGFYGHPVAYIAPSVYGHPQVRLKLLKIISTTTMHDLTC